MLEKNVWKNTGVIFYLRGRSDKLIWTDPWDYNKSDQRAVFVLLYLLIYWEYRGRDNTNETVLVAAFDRYM